VGRAAGEDDRRRPRRRPAYPVLTGDYAAERAHWGSTPIEVGRPLAKPSPIIAKLAPELGETGPEWAPVQK
jgi:methionyl-tRNA synthetase